MTARKHFKQHVRARMERTGESYSTARRHVVHQTDSNGAVPWHFPGNVPATTALRSVLAAAGVRDPRTGKPFTERTLYGIAGGVGIGVFTFCYEKENFASFFVAGRHLWHDDLAYLTAALGRFGIKPEVRETGSAKAAEKALREAVADGPCIAWVDMGCLPHRAMPEKWSGGGYHVVTAYGVEPDGTVLVGDLADEPVSVPGPAFAKARARIKGFKNRLLWISKADGPKELAPLVRDGLRACRRGLTGELGVKTARTNFSLAALRVWAERLSAPSGRESWAQIFPRGSRLWGGLTSIVQFVEHWGGGGLGRPLFAEFLSEAGHESLAVRYSAIGKRWSELADVALPRTVAPFREARDIYVRIGELTMSGGDPAETRAAWERLGALAAAARTDFPLSDAEWASLRAELRERVQTLFDEETVAHAELARAVG